jgi:hypothetical protein
MISSTITTAANSLSSTELTIDANTGLISLYTANNAAVGSHTATVSVGLVSYPSITQATANFIITIGMC